MASMAWQMIFIFMADPFLDIEKLSKGTDLVNDFSEAIGGYISALDIGDGGKVFEKNNAYLGLTWGGSIADLNLSITEDSGIKIKEDDYGGSSALGTGVKGQLYWPGNMNMQGLDTLVEDGFDTVTPTSLDEISETNQTLNLALYGEGKVNAPFDFDFKIEDLRTEVLGVGKTWNEDIATSDELVGDPEQVRTNLKVPIEYDPVTGLVGIGKYEFIDFDFAPNLSMAWDVIYDEALKPVADWWDDAFSVFSAFETVPNPIKELNENVENQMNSGDNAASEWLGGFISDQLNSESVKPFVHASFKALLVYSWNQDDYPANFLM